MAGRRFLITAGPTREPIDAVRFIGNRSSGKLGVALARAARERGHEVTLLAGPGVEVGACQLPVANCQSGMRVYRFESTVELQQLAEAHFRDCDVLIMAAAVADYRPAQRVEGKLPRQGEQLVLRLEPTPDVVAGLAKLKRPEQRIVAFALEEPEHLETRAVEKMRRKGVDAIVANPLGTMEAEGITALWLTAGGQRGAPGRMSKAEFAGWLVRQIEMW